MSWLEQVAIKLVIKFLESSVTPEAVEAGEAKALEALRAAAAKTPTKLDDAVVESLITMLTTGGLGQVLEAEVVARADAFVASTKTELDDQIWAVVKKAIQGA